MKKWVFRLVTKFKSLNVSKKFLIALGISLACYLVFFYKLFSPNFFFWGSDVPTQYYPPRVYLRETILKEHRFPFWTEKLYSGFPLYSDMENAYLDLPNIISILLFGPMWSYKILHLTEYLIGSMCIYFLLKRKGYGLVSFFITNLVFYFSFFNLNHQIHLNVIMISYLLPIHILLTDLFLEHKKIKFLVLQSLVLAHGIYWGHPQFTLITAIVIALYLLIMGLKKISLKTIAFYLFFVGLLSVIETLPLTIPAFPLYKNSPRNGDVSYLQGILPPNAAVVVIYPYIFGTWKNFVDPTASRLTYTETYIYIGISVTLLASAAIVVINRDRFFWFLYSLILLFLFFAFIRYTPIGQYKHPILIDLFRYWERAIFATAFGFGALAGIFLETLPKTSLKMVWKGLILLFLPILYIFVLYFTNFNNERVVFVREALQKFSYVFVKSQYFITWKMILVVTSIFIILVIYISHFYKKNTTLKLYKYVLVTLLCGIVLFDLRFNAINVLDNRIFDLRTIYEGNLGKIETPKQFINKRVFYSKFYSTYEFQGNEYLYLKSWSPFGYSQFFNREYAELLNRAGFSSYKGSRAAGYSNCNDSKVPLLKPVGVTYLYVSPEIICPIQETKPIDVIANNVEGSYIKKKEGDLEMKLSNFSTNPLTLNTYLRSDQDWYLFIDGKKENINKALDFMSFQLPTGQHDVHFKFIPYSFYKAVAISSLSVVVLSGVYYFTKKRIYEFLNN